MHTESDENTDENRTDKEPAAALSAAAEQIRRIEKENANAMFQIEWKSRAAWLEAVVFDMDGHHQHGDCPGACREERAVPKSG